MSDIGTVRRCFAVFRRDYEMLLSVNRGCEMLMRECVFFDCRVCPNRDFNKIRKIPAAVSRKQQSYRCRNHSSILHAVRF